MCDQDQDQPYIAPGFDANLHDCQSCLDTGISQETAGYCTACRMGKRIEQLDQFAEQLKGHGFTEAMRIVYRTTQRTEKAIAAADKALMMAKNSAHAFTERERKVIHLALHKFMCDAYGRANHAAQDKEYKFFGKGVFELMMADAKDAEALLPRFAASPVSKQG